MQSLSQPCRSWITWAWTRIRQSTADVTIGARLAGGSTFGNFNGTVGQCALFNTVLTPAQISDLYDAATQAPSGGGGAGEPVTQRRDHNYLNQITRTTEDSEQTSLVYDKNGNLLDDGTRLLAYDALNRLIEVKRKSDSAVVGQYTYDAQGRRIRKVITNGGISGSITNGTIDFLYAPGSWQCCEERNATNQPTRHYVWGIYIDELIQQRNNPGGAAGTQADRYLLSGFLYNATAVTDASGAIVEAYDLDPYGNRLIFTTAASGGNWWSDAATQSLQGQCVIGHQGLYHDVETGLVYNRARALHTGLGRFCQRDPVYEHEVSRYEISMLNCYQYLTSGPVNDSDPLGTLSRQECLKKLKGLFTHIKEVKDHYSKGHCGAIAAALEFFASGGSCHQWSGSKDLSDLLKYIELIHKLFCKEPPKTPKERKHRVRLVPNCGVCPIPNEKWAKETLVTAGLVTAGVAIIIFDVLTFPSGEGLCGVALIRYAFVAL